MCCQKRACSQLQQDTQVAMCAMPATCEHNDNPASMRTTRKTQHTLEHLKSPLPAPREGQDALQSRGEDTVLKIAAALPALLRRGQQKRYSVIKAPQTANRARTMHSFLRVTLLPPMCATEGRLGSRARQRQQEGTRSAHPIHAAVGHHPTRGTIRLGMCEARSTPRGASTRLWMALGRHTPHMHINR